ncbi:uncharacterized protein LOC115944280 isoform X2 [Leptonychotes weddellii]|uniref:Uncharacterized protein LOC115944280 isoform X2 n=1 Tax=Leptonychotes weddellii TaxID=9713 RepID=A0A7F8RNG1_LEPWE|nr:uncharacterized protein LOC115944280 isoform X2 [Leptonychotes weddellii]
MFLEHSPEAPAETHNGLPQSAFDQNLECTTPGVSFRVNDGLWVMMTGQHPNSGSQHLSQVKDGWAAALVPGSRERKADPHPSHQPWLREKEVPEDRAAQGSRQLPGVGDDEEKSTGAPQCAHGCINTSRTRKEK